MEAVFKSRLRALTALMICFGLSAGLMAQSDKAKGDKAFELLRYQQAINHYEAYLEDHSDLETSLLLAEAYYKTAAYQEATQRLYRHHLAQELDASHTLKLAELYLLTDQRQKAQEVLDQYRSQYDTNAEYDRLLASAQMVASPSKSDYKYLVERADFSSEVSDFSPAYWGDRLVFTSQKGGKQDPWTGRSFSNIYLRSSDGEITQLKGNLNGKFHNGAVCFADDEMIYTRNNKKRGQNDDYNLILAIAKVDGDKVDYKADFPYNDKNFSNAYPAYIAAAKALVFASDRPGGQGGMDLYICQRKGDSWTEPRNLGPEINTAGDEVFPTYHEGHLYFSSNGRAGLGGLDIYSTTFVEKAGTDIDHLPSPINSHGDDFGLISQDGMATGYLSSNRAGSPSVDDIFTFEKEKVDRPAVAMKLTGIVLDELTRIPLKETTVLLTASDGSVQKVVTGENGRFAFDIMTKESYSLNGEKNGIATTSEETGAIAEGEQYYYTLLHNDPRYSLEGYALNTKDKSGVQGVVVNCYNTALSTEQDELSRGDGFFKFQLEQDSDFEISGSKNGYYTSVSTASTKGLDRSTTLYVKLYLNVEEVVIGDTKILGKESMGGWDFDPVYYDLDKANIRPDAALALDKVVDFLQQNPTLEIELGSHTDSRASDDYNMDLSQRRARAAVEYIVSRGVDSGRITARGYGESQVVNGCSDGVVCSEDEHQLNRRTEIKVVGY